MDIEKLIEQLRTKSLYADRASLEIMDLCMDAATALSTLQAENEKLREKIEDARLEGYAKGLGEMNAELEQAKEELDSAISDMTYIARTYPVDLGDDLVCQYCKHYPNANTGCPGWTENDCFEWRGQKED